MPPPTVRVYRRPTRNAATHIVALATFILSAVPSLAQSLVDYVNPFIGTSYGANTFPGAVVPWGMVSVSPHNELRRPSGYYWDDAKKLVGFGHVHLSGVGCFDLANIALMPTTGAIVTDRTKFASTIGRQQASPGFYSCYVDRYAVQASMTATERAGLSRYVFDSATNDANILIDVSQGVSPSQGGHVKIVSDSQVEGWNISGRFCDSPTHQKVHFVARFSRRARVVRTWSDTIVSNQRVADGMSIGAALTFDVGVHDTIYVKVGISYTSIANARRNLDEEIADWSFERVHDSARARWQTELSHIRVSGGTLDERVIFYSALYHSLLHPNLFHDVSREYRLMGDRGIGRADDYDRYTVFSLWDTYRTVHPLLAMAWPERQSDMVRTLIEKYRENGWLPKWSLVGMEAFCMNGDPAVIVIADTWAKGIRNFDLATAFEGMLKNATDTSDDNWVRPGLSAYIQHGFVPPDHRTGHWDVYGPTSTTLEYSLADWNIARVAAELCRTDEYARYAKRADAWRLLWDESSQFFRVRLANGQWLSPWDPAEYDTYYTEGTAYHYRFFLPQEMPALVDLYGGGAAFTDSLQSFFDRGMFMWNEHDLAYPYLFTYVDGQSWRTHDAVRKLMKEFMNRPDGIRANDDGGTISAWYALSAMGLYPVANGTDEYQIGSPIFDTITVTPRGSESKPFVITAAGTSNARRYVEGASLNGRTLRRPQLRAREIAAGGLLDLKMSLKAEPWGHMLRPPDSLHVISDVAPEAIVAWLRWRPRENVRMIRVQASTDPAMCTLLRDSIMDLHDSVMMVSLDTAVHELWWRIASVDDHGAEAWSNIQAHRFIPDANSRIAKGYFRLERIDANSMAVHYRLPIEDPGVVIVYNMLGREVARYAAYGRPGASSLTIDLSRLATGSYICRLLTARNSATIAFAR